MLNYEKKAIGITGLGVISPIGIGKNAFWKSLRDGKSNFNPITHFNTEGFKSNIASEITDFNPREFLGKTGLMDWDRASLFLSSAVKLALEDAGLVINAENTSQVGVVVGSTFGSLFSISEFDKEALRDGPRLANPSVFTSTVGNSPASRVSIQFVIKGFNTTISTGMSSALDAVDYGCDFLKLNRAKIVVSGTVESLSPQIFLGFKKLNYLADESMPFDLKRSGIVLSEGAVGVILETIEDAKKRGVRIYSEILGIGSVFDPVKSYKYNPIGKGMKDAMKLALADARLKPEDIDCVFANANSTKDADRIEAGAIKEVFGVYAKNVPVTAIKSILGETYSASGGMSLAAALCALNEGVIPAIINVNKIDPECSLNLVLETANFKNLSRVMINSFGPTGDNTSIIIGRVA